MVCPLGMQYLSDHIALPRPSFLRSMLGLPRRLWVWDLVERLIPWVQNCRFFLGLLRILLVYAYLLARILLLRRWELFSHLLCARLIVAEPVPNFSAGEALRPRLDFIGAVTLPVPNHVLLDPVLR